MSRKAEEVSEISYLFRTKNSIPLSQFLRLRRLCNDHSDFFEKIRGNVPIFSINVAILLLPFKRATTVPSKLVSVPVFSGGDRLLPGFSWLSPRKSLENK